MDSEYSNRRLIAELVVGSLLWGGLAFFLDDEIPPGWLKVSIFYGAAFIIGIFMLVRRNMTGKDLVLTAVVFGVMIAFFGTVTRFTFDFVLDAAIRCDKGQLMDNPDGSAYRTVHSHRRRFHCVICTDPHLSYERVVH